MKIQEESPLPTSPLEGLEEDYGSAVVHIAWDRHSESGELTLLFAFVELLPTEIPAPLDDYDFKAPRSSQRLGGESQHCIYIRHAVLPARDALDWYLACRIGNAVLPWGKRSPVKLADLGEEPPWPTLISASDDSTALPFKPQWIHCPRTHHLLPLVDFDLGQLWSEEEKEKAQGWLEDRLHFELEKYPEYWGSVHLVAPNPVYREMRARLQRREPPAESVLVRFKPRAGKSVEGLELVFREKDPWGVTASRRATVVSPLMRMNFNREVNAVMEDVWDARRGLLEASSNAYSFMKTFKLDLGFTRKVVVQMQGQPYEVMRSGRVKRSTAGVLRKIGGARSRLLGAHFARRKRATAEGQDQRWFKDQNEEARNLLRSLLNAATSSVLLVDPYFGAEELGEFMLAVGREDIPIHILSASSELRKPISDGSTLPRGDQLLDTLRQLRAHEQMNPFEIRVMRGKKPDVHDRFLAVDKSIWLLGSSLKEFGSRGTMMIALPDPDAVRDDLLKAWNDAEVLETWVERRSREKTGGKSA